MADLADVPSLDEGVEVRQGRQLDTSLARLLLLPSALARIEREMNERANAGAPSSGEERGDALRGVVALRLVLTPRSDA